MSKGLERAAAITQALSPRYRSLIGDNRFSDPFFVLGNVGLEDLEGGDCLATSLMAYSQYPIARIIRETLKTEEAGIETHFFLAELISRGYNPTMDRYNKIVGTSSTDAHFKYWSGVSPGNIFRSECAVVGPNLLKQLISQANNTRVVQRELVNGDTNGTLRFALVDPVEALRTACHDNSATFSELSSEIDKALENFAFRV